MSILRSISGVVNPRTGHIEAITPGAGGGPGEVDLQAWSTAHCRVVLLQAIEVLAHLQDVAHYQPQVDAEIADLRAAITAFEKAASVDRGESR